MTDEQIIKMQAQQLFVERQRIAELERQLAAAKEDTARLDWLDQSSSVTADEASEIVNGHRWNGKLFDSVRQAIDAARK